MPLVTLEGLDYGGLVLTQPLYEDVATQLPLDMWTGGQRPEKYNKTLLVQSTYVAPSALYNAAHKCCIVDGRWCLVRMNSKALDGRGAAQLDMYLVPHRASFCCLSV